jgi:hypothetical protein
VALQAGDRGGRWLGCEPLLLGLLESLDLAAGLRMVGPGVVEADPESAEFDLEGDAAAAAGCAGEDGAVVGEHAGGDSPLHKGMLKGAEDIGAGDAAPHVAAEGAAGVVVEEVENLDVGAVGELPVGGVGLPAFVRLLGREPAPRRPGSLLGLGGDEAAPGQDAPDRRDRRHRPDRCSR